jgi:DNA-binding NarL/FixJ family response regulator
MAVATPEGLERTPAVSLVPTAGVVGPDGVNRVKVAQLLEAGGYTVTFESAGGDDVREDFDAEVIVLLGDSQPHLMAAEIRSLRAQLPEGSLIAVVSADDRRGAVQVALGAGARVYVALDRLEEAFIPSLTAALVGQVVLPAAREGQGLDQVLTAREKQVLALVVMGMTNAEIASKLFLAESTVKSHLSSAFGKLGVRSRNEAAAMILDPDSGVGLGILTIPTQDEPSRAA